MAHDAAPRRCWGRCSLTASAPSPCGLLAALRVAARRPRSATRSPRATTRRGGRSIRALASENVPLSTVAKDSGVIASDDIMSPIGVYADCGRLGDVALEGEALVTFTVFVQANGTRDATAGQCQDAHAGLAARASGKLKPSRVYQCVSTGRWEANLMDTLRRLVKE